MAQSNGDIWAMAVNLSHSGAASHPVIVAQPDGSLRVFWWDRFDGVTMAEGTLVQGQDSPAEWADPLPVPIFVAEALERPTEDGDEFVYTPLDAMPLILGDAAGQAHAFWLGEADEETGAYPLLYARLAPSNTTWTIARVLAESATGLSATVDALGNLHLAYVRGLNTSRSPSGVYYRRSEDGGASWQTPAQVYLSRYLRLLSFEDTRLFVAADDTDGVYVTWDDPYLEGVQLAASLDGGITWGVPVQVDMPVGGTEGRAQHGRVIPVFGETTLLLWEVLRPDGVCELYQAPVQDVLEGAGTGGQQILSEWKACLPAKQVLSLAAQGLDSERVLLTAERKDGFTLLATWDGVSWQRSKPLSIHFDDPEQGGRVQLNTLHWASTSVTETEGPARGLAIVGTDEKGEVWITGGQLETLEPVLEPVTPTPTPTPRLRLPGPSTPGSEGEELDLSTPQPVNLSLSGAASHPVIVSGPEGALRAFWWDAFDGLMVAEGAVWSTSVLSGTQALSGTLDIWADAVPAPILFVDTTGAEAVGTEPSEEQAGFASIDVMPHIVADAAGRSHAFWLPGEGGATGEGPLRYSMLDATSVVWSLADVLAESAVAYDVAALGDHTLHLVYLRTQHTADAAAGLYHRRSDDGGATWSAPVPIDTSRYYRMLTPESSHVRLVVDGAENVYVTWDQPSLEQLLLAESLDGGSTWGKPLTVGAPDGWAQRGRLFGASRDAKSEVWLMWEDAHQGGGCSLYQAPVRAVMQDLEITGERVLDDLTSCPNVEQFLGMDRTETLMVVGGGSDALTLAAWNGKQWSEPRRLSYRFEDPERGTPVYLGGLQAVLTGEALIAVGTDGEGDVWVTPGRMGALDLVFAPPSPWSPLANVSQLEEGDASETFGLPAIAADAEGGLHLLWAQGEAAGGSGTALYYSRGSTAGEDGGSWTRPAAVLGSPVDGASASTSTGGVKEPSLAVQGERLHALWSGGANGQIWYSRAFLQDAHTAVGWEDPRPLPGPTEDLEVGFEAGSAPYLLAGPGAAQHAALHALYAVPVNEGRGIYYTRSDDGGETWSPSVAVFDAAAAGWTSVDTPRLAVDAATGAGQHAVLHAVWVRAALSPDQPPQGVYYAHSEDDGETWSEAQTVVEGAYAWPQVALSGPGQVHLLWNEASGGGVWHRWSAGVSAAQAEPGEGWTRAERVPGFGDVPGLVGLAADGAGVLYLAGLGYDDAGGPALLYLPWNGTAEREAGGGGWGSRETFRLDLESSEPGIRIALQPALGKLDVVLRGQARGAEETPLDVWHTGRAVPPAVELLPTVVPDDPVETPSPTPTPGPTPTATPNLSGGPPPDGGGSSGLPLPLLLGGGLAALIVAGALGTRWLWAVRR